MIVVIIFLAALGRLFLMMWGLLTIFLKRNIIRKEYGACLKLIFIDYLMGDRI